MRSRYYYNEQMFDRFLSKNLKDYYIEIKDELLKYEARMFSCEALIMVMSIINFVITATLLDTFNNDKVENGAKIAQLCLLLISSLLIVISSAVYWRSFLSYDDRVKIIEKILLKMQRRAMKRIRELEGGDEAAISSSYNSEMEIINGAGINK